MSDKSAAVDAFVMPLPYKAIERTHFIMMPHGSNHRRCSAKKSVLEKFANFTGKHL